MSKQAKPWKLSSGEWGAVVTGSVSPGETITITTAAGKSWDAVVAKVLFSRDGKCGVMTVAKGKSEPVSFDGSKAIIGQHWSSRGKGPLERLCAGGCGRRVSGKYAECFNCHQESVEAM